MTKRKLKQYGNIFIIAMLICTVIITSAISLHGFALNRTTRVFDEMERVTKLQVDFLNLEIDEQYVPLNSLADYITDNNAVFGEGDTIIIAESLKSVHRLCTIGLADINGNCVDYQGNVMNGNISDRDYFQNVIDGTHDKYITYLDTTKSVNEPRVLFSVPLYENDTIVGVIFASKEINVLEQAFFLEDFFDENVSSFIVDKSGTIIAANNKTHADIASGKLFDSDTSTALQEKAIIEILNNGNCDGCTSIMKDGKYLTHTPIDINDWMLVNMVDEQSVILQYQESENILIKTITALIIIVFSIVAIISAFFHFDQKRLKREAENFQRQHNSYKSLLYEMNCAVIEYDTINGQIQYTADVSDALGLSEKSTFNELNVSLQKTHPEFNINELKAQVALATREYRSVSFESIFTNNNNEIQWFKILLLPIQNISGDVTNIFAAILNTTEYHQEFETYSEFMAAVPGGMHRCYLDNPIHLEFVSDGLCKMLGYTTDEFNEMVGSKYSLAIAEEDRAIFRDFVHELSHEEGTKTCEYRMICKDGSYLTVSDTMESKRNAIGVMYGYSIIIDLSEYKKKQEEMELELSETKAQLLQARITNANSQMQPHFLYNALASIREIVLEDPEYASDLLFDFSTHLRACIRSMSNDSMVSFSQELDNIKAYVNIEQMRFGKKLKVSYDIEETDFEIVPLSLQPIVENAIRHGIYERGRAGGTVYIKTYAEDNSWVIQIADDGVGFDVEEMWAQIKSGQRDSTGLQNMVLRFEKQMKATVDIRSSVGIGTKVTIYIPKGAENESYNC